MLYYILRALGQTAWLVFQLEERKLVDVFKNVSFKRRKELGKAKKEKRDVKRKRKKEREMNMIWREHSLLLIIIYN